MIESQRRITLDVLMACWGMGTWLGINGLYVQLPLLVERLPEGWALPSSMVLAIQLANSGLLMYALLKRLLPRVSDSTYIYGLLSVGTLALAINSGVHELSAPVAGEQRSVPFITLTFLTGLVGCTSSVLFYPYLKNFRDMYLITYLVGEGLSGFVPSLLALVQGVGGEPECLPGGGGDPAALEPHYPPPRFGSTTFIALLATLSAMSLTAFALLNSLPTYDLERVVDPPPTAHTASNKDGTLAKMKKASLSSTPWIAAFVLIACLNALMNGVLPSIQTYSCRPYGTQAYHLAVTLSAMANPTANMLGVWLRPLALRLLVALLAVTLVPTGYIVATALLSQSPPLVGTAAGEALVVIAWVAVSGALSYGRMWAYVWARGGGQRGMRAVGTSGQLGSALGSVATFFIVNYTHLFVEVAVCPPIQSV